MSYPLLETLRNFIIPSSNSACSRFVAAAEFFGILDVFDPIRKLHPPLPVDGEDQGRLQFRVCNPNGENRMQRHARFSTVARGTFGCSLIWFVCWTGGQRLAPAAEIIETVAGTGQPDNNGDAGQGSQIHVGDPFGVEIGPDGALYVTEVRNHRVRRLDLETGEIATVAGCGRKGYFGDGGPATSAGLNEPYEVRFDKRGNMYFVEMQNHLIRKVDVKTGIISTLAGTGEPGYAGDGGPGSQAQFNRPHSIALDNDGHLFVADIGNHRIRKVDLQTGIVDSVAGTGERTLPSDGGPATGNPVIGPRALDIEGRVMWVALREGHSVWTLHLDDLVWRHLAGSGKRGFSGDGGPAKDATFDGPKGIAVGPQGRVFVVDTENQVVRRIDPRSGTIETIAGGGPQARGGGGDGGPATQAELDRPHGVCVAADGAVYIGDTLNHRVRRVRSSRP